MRKSIRLTGRRQLPKSYFRVTLSGEGSGKAVHLAISSEWDRSGLPADAEVRLKLVENKCVEVLRFGSVSMPSSIAPLNNDSFRAPSCELRIVCRDDGNDGLLLASTNSWTLRSAGDPEGILLFQAANIQPRLWRLEVRAQEHPVLYIDEHVPNAAHWARTDPVFAACVLPSVIASVFRSVLQSEEAAEDGWEADWINWAADLAPGSAPPFGTENETKEHWIEGIVDAFAVKHALAQNVISKLEGEA
jgi:hypothetical protein